MRSWPKRRRSFKNCSTRLRNKASNWDQPGPPGSASGRTRQSYSHARATDDQNGSAVANTPHRSRLPWTPRRYARCQFLSCRTKLQSQPSRNGRPPRRMIDPGCHWLSRGICLEKINPGNRSQSSLRQSMSWRSACLSGSRAPGNESAPPRSSPRRGSAWEILGDLEGWWKLHHGHRHFSAGRAPAAPRSTWAMRSGGQTNTRALGGSGCGTVEAFSRSGERSAAAGWMGLSIAPLCSV